MLRTATALLLATLLAGSASAQPLCDVQGAWEMIEVRLVYPNRVEHPDHRARQTKILTPTHFAFGRQTDDEEEVYAGGGRYRLEGSTYTEIIEYHSSPPLVGTEITFDCRIEGGLWYHSGQIGDFRLEEVWRRIGDSKATLEGLSETERLNREARYRSNVQTHLYHLQQRN